MRRTCCGSCGNANLEPVLDLGYSPLADAFPEAIDEIEMTYPLQLFVCDACWLVQLGEIVPDDILWSDYGFYSSTSPAIAAYHRALADLLMRRHPDQVQRLTVEIACNDGSLLSQINSPRLLGVDPAEGPALQAIANGLDVRVTPFTKQLAENLHSEMGPAGLVIASNVAAHVADLSDFLLGITTLLADDGVAVIEVQSLADLLLGNQFDHVYHEHRSFFSATSLIAACREAGLNVVNVERTPMQGGSIRVTCQRQWVKKLPVAAKLLLQGEDGFTNSMASFAGLQARAEQLRNRLIDLLADEISAGRKVAGFAASAKSTTLLNWCGIRSNVVGHVVDTTPHKIGRYTPGTKIPIVGPGELSDPDTYLLLAWNYVSRIRTDPFKGRWLVPIPQPVIL